MESIAQRLRKVLPGGIPTSPPLKGMGVISRSDPLSLWAQLIAAIEQETSVAFLNPEWPEVWRQQLTDLAKTLPASSEPSILIPTSGSSDLPKFCIHDLDTLTCAAIGFSQRFGSIGLIHAVSVLPQHHVGGFMPILRSMECGGMVHFADYRDAASISAAPFPLHQATISVVPTQLRRMISDPAGLAVLQQFGLILLGGAACPSDILALARAHRLNLAPCYGSTETAAMVTVLAPEEFLEGVPGVGNPLPHARIETDLQDRILVHAGSNLRAYLPDRENFSRTPFLTGDLGILDGEGGLQVKGRADRVIISGGEKIHPEQVESATMGTGLVTEAQCRGVPDPDWGQRVELLVVPAHESLIKADLLDQLRLALPAFALPKEIHFAEQISLNSMGKINESED